jgi:hypothetical protein
VTHGGPKGDKDEVSSQSSTRSLGPVYLAAVGALTRSLMMLTGTLVPAAPSVPRTQVRRHHC